jgi:hypothetical protein
MLLAPVLGFYSLNMVALVDSGRNTNVPLIGHLFLKCPACPVVVVDKTEQF